MQNLFFVNVYYYYISVCFWNYFGKYFYFSSRNNEKNCEIFFICFFTTRHFVVRSALYIHYYYYLFPKHFWRMIFFLFSRNKKNCEIVFICFYYIFNDISVLWIILIILAIIVVFVKAIFSPMHSKGCKVSRISTVRIRTTMSLYLNNIVVEVFDNI